MTEPERQKLTRLQRGLLRITGELDEMLRAWDDGSGCLRHRPDHSLPCTCKERLAAMPPTNAADWLGVQDGEEPDSNRRPQIVLERSADGLSRFYPEVPGKEPGDGG